MSRIGTPHRPRCRRPFGRPHAICAFALSIGGVAAVPIPAHADGPSGPPAPPGLNNALAPIPASPPTPVDAAPHVVYAGKPLPVATADATPFRDPLDGALCVAPASLAPLGVIFIIDRSANVVTFCGPDGATTVTVPLRAAPGNLPGPTRRGPFVSAVETIEGLGGACSWNPATSTLVTRAVLTSVEMLGGQLRIKATLPVAPTISDQRDGRRIIVDVSGAEIGKLPHTIDLQSPMVANGRVGQFTEDTARVVLDMKQPYAFSVLGGKPSTIMVLNPTAPTATTAIVSTVVKPTSHGGSDNVKHGPLSIVSGVAFQKISDTEARFVIGADRAPSIRAGLANGRLTLDLLNATLSDHAADLTDMAHPFLREAHLIANGTAAAQLVLDLTRAVVYTIRPSDKGPVELDLSLPRGAVGKLSGKTIVVDPGHGGHDSGALGVNGTREKDVNLAIATEVANTLRDAGANVILTRSSDYFIPVDDRPVIANRSSADFFLSVHSDSGDRNHSINGSTVYFHFNQPSCKTLAQCIADRLAKGSDIGSRGVGSDGVRFPGQGFGVLRNSQMVAVLVECGYMSNRDDVRKLNTQTTQKRIALSIVAGLRDYIEGNPKADTRDVNPQIDGGTASPAPFADSPGSPANGSDGSPTPAPNMPGASPQAAPPGVPDNKNMPISPAAPVKTDDSIVGQN